MTITPDLFEAHLRCPTKCRLRALHAIECIPAEGRGKAAQFIPIRFIWRNRLTKDDKLLLTPRSRAY